ncbi:MAG: hypothetical protein K0R78_3671 [Pelosinus sp.]|jgi:hypothetical protein|nr:hypothetical protein [Pelosinus sp.]
MIWSRLAFGCFIPIVFLARLSRKLCKPPRWCKIEALNLEVLFMAKRKITPERREQRKKLLELLQGAGINDVAGVQEW